MTAGERRRLGEWGSALEDDSIFSTAGGLSLASSVSSDAGHQGTRAWMCPLSSHPGAPTHPIPSVSSCAGAPELAHAPTGTTAETGAGAATPVTAPLPAPASVAAIKEKLLRDKQARLAAEEAERAKKERLAKALAVPKVPIQRMSSPYLAHI